ncbi:MAG TPA: PepSY domain-containing protein, partial [Fimbriiglobus sp.]
AGLLCAPALIVTALTGAMLIFKEEIEAAGRPGLAYVVPGGVRKPFDDLVAAVRAKYPNERLARATIYGAADRSVVIQMVRGAGRRSDVRLVFVNPYSAAVLGDAALPGEDEFFNVVLALHQHLYSGSVGRTVVEFVTSWTIVLTVSGIYLWWPRRISAVLGVWLPRCRAPAYTILRDLHALPGTAFALVTVLLAGTGLFFSHFWGSEYSWLVGDRGKYPFALTEPPVRPAAAGAEVPAEIAVHKARSRWPEATLMLEWPQKPTAPFAFTARHPQGDMVFGFLAVDRTSGDVVADRRAEDVPFPAQVRLWVYPIHVGSIDGTPTKVLALLGCFVLVASAISSMAMWLVRRPRGTAGFTASASAHVPWPAALVILALAVALPTVGMSLVLVLAGEWAWERSSRRNSIRIETQDG